MLNKHLFLLIITVVVIVFAGLYLIKFAKTDLDSNDSGGIRSDGVFPPKAALEEVEASDYNFSRKGVAIKENAKYNGENLFILYEEPGKPALRARLKFDGESVCGDENHSIVCLALSVSDYGLSNGRKIEVRGIESDGVVSVRRLIRLD